MRKKRKLLYRLFEIAANCGASEGEQNLSATVLFTRLLISVVLISLRPRSVERSQ